MRRSCWIIVSLLVSAYGCERARGTEREALAFPQETDGREAARGAPAHAQRTGTEPDRTLREPIGAAPEDRASLFPGQGAEQPSSPGSAARFGPAEEVGAGPEPARVAPDPTPGAAGAAPGASKGAAETTAARGVGGGAQSGGAAAAEEAGLAAQRLRQGVSERPRRMATAELERESPGDEGAALDGTVVLTEDDRGVLVEANVAGLSPGPHRLVIRDSPSCDEASATAARATRRGEERAARGASERARGEAPQERPSTGEEPLGEVDVGPDGVLRYEVLTRRLSLEEDGPESAIGKTFVVEPERSSESSLEGAACGAIESAG